MKYFTMMLHRECLRQAVKPVQKMMVLLLGAVLLATASLAHSQEYPTRPIRVLVPFPPGGVVDIAARLLTANMTERLGWSFIVENRPGGNGFIAVTAAIRSAPDGYTLLMAHTGEFAVNPALFPNVPYQLSDFVPITLVSDTPLLIVANSKAPYNTFRELVDYAKKNPGKLSYASPGTGTVNHITGEWLALESGVQLLHIPYKGGAPAGLAVAADEVPLAVAAVSSVLPHIAGGRVKVIGLTTAKRSPLNEAWTTANEAGIPNVDASNWVGLFAPKGVPADIIAKLHREAVKTLGTPEIKKRFGDHGAEVGGTSSAEFTTRIENDAKRFKAVIQRAGIKPD